jgi:predicted thioesterase
MDTNLKLGMAAELEETVGIGNTAQTWGSGGLDVYATPAMIALMEMASHAAVDHYLPEGFSTVGTIVNIRHVSATPSGLKVHARGELIEIDRRRLVFKVSAWDDAGIIGDGLHERYIVNNEKFLAGAAKKQKQ